MENLKLILNDLESMKQYRPRGAMTKFETLVNQGWKYGIISALVPFSVLCLLALWHNFISPLAPIWVTIAVWSGLLSQFLASLTLLCPPILLAGSIWFWKAHSRALRDAELDHDQAFVAVLLKYAPEDLRSAKQHLEVKLKRLERRLGYFIEADGKKFALFSLLILNFTFGNLLTKGDWSSLFSSTSSSPIFTIIMIILLVISIGAMTVKVATNRDTYRMELIDLTLMKNK